MTNKEHDMLWDLGLFETICFQSTKKNNFWRHINNNLEYYDVITHGSK